MAMMAPVTSTSSRMVTGFRMTTSRTGGSVRGAAAASAAESTAPEAGAAPLLRMTSLEGQSRVIGDRLGGAERRSPLPGRTLPGVLDGHGVLRCREAGGEDPERVDPSNDAHQRLDAVRIAGIHRPERHLA